MIIPVRCWTCGNVIADRWDACQTMVQEGATLEAALDEVGIDRYCCRRMFLSHVELVDDVAPYSTTLQR